MVHYLLYLTFLDTKSKLGKYKLLQNGFFQGSQFHIRNVKTMMGELNFPRFPFKIEG